MRAGNKLNLQMKRVTREEREESRVDVNRFLRAEDYMTEESLKYFRNDFNRKLFREMFFNDKDWSNDTMLSLTRVSTPVGSPSDNVHTPTSLVWDVMLKDFSTLAMDCYNIDNATCQKYFHEGLFLMKAYESGLLDRGVKLSKFLTQHMEMKMQNRV